MTKVLLALAALAALAGSASATPAFAQKEKKPCLYCHTSPRGGSRTLNDAGKWYHAKKTLVGFKPAATRKPTPTPPPKKKK